jgi:hypothetical protein
MLTFPTIPLIVFGQPVALVLLWATMGALFLPFLSLTLLYLLNSRRVAPEYRSRLLSNAVLGISLVVFAVLGVQTVLDLL